MICGQAASIMDLEAGQTLTIQAGGRTLRIALDHAGNLGVADGRGAWLPPLQEEPGRWSFEVDEEHPDLSDNGKQAATMIEMIDGADSMGACADIESLIRFLANLAERDHRLPGALLLRCRFSDETIREFAEILKLGRSRTAEMLQQLEAHEPKLHRLLFGRRTAKAESQRRRRTLERGKATQGSFGRDKPVNAKPHNADRTTGP